MEILTEQNLVNALRKLSDSVKERLWIAVPYIGGKYSVDKIFGNNWQNKLPLDIKLLTDASNSSNLDSETINHLLKKGEIRSLLGLHAKIYIIDDSCILTSANLTKTAFANRYEIGILCDLFHSDLITKVFEEWWAKAEKVNQSFVNKAFKINTKSIEENNFSLPILWELPQSPESKLEDNPVMSNIKYWRIGTTGNNNDFWPEMLDNNWVSIGWSEIGNLKAIRNLDRNQIKSLFEAEDYYKAKNVISRKSGEVFDFFHNLKPGDIVLPSKGNKVRQ